MSIQTLRTNLPESPQIRLNTRFGRPPLTMKLDCFFEFSFWLAEELLELEEQFADRSSDPEQYSPQTFDANGLPEDLQIDFD